MSQPVLELNGARLSRLLRAGIQRLLADREHLNRINVFPVADGDTGTNMALTMSAVLTSLRRAADDHAGTTLARAADAALDGARGNSGAILAQFLLGMGDSAASHAALSTAQFATAVTNGASYARESLSEPREGTVLTVITDFAAETARLAATGLHDYLSLFSQALHKARTSLQRTAEQLEELRAARVVDAGAQGFVDLLEGMLEHLHKDVDAEPAEALIHSADNEVTAGEVHDLSHRFCTECTITGDNIDRRRLREQLATLGSSLVLAGTARKAKIHIHVNDPAEVFFVASQFGVLTAQKADDMQRQQQAAHDRRRRVAIVTDSVADIPDELLDELGIHIVPLRIQFGEQSYLDKVGLSAQEFLAELVRNPQHPKTSQPPPGDFRRQFEILASHFDSVISIHVTGKVSGTHNAAQSAAGWVQRSNSIEVLDSFNVSIGQGLLAIRAAELASQGLNADQIMATIRKLIPLTRTYALIGSMEYAVRGGRVKPAVRSIANALSLSPVLATHPDGRIAPAGMLFGRRNRPDKLVRFIVSRMKRGESYRVGIGHADAEAGAHDLLEQLRRAHSKIESAYVMPLGSTLSVHGGPGTLVVGVQPAPSS
ncbi:DegV family EDD domain-containing protein [Steroidobacter sp. S1-65]|uniref:DegV family EDD domain-containing protein n=1 Tax=Steroidobacter gossypii TaxID=2805490 RepID=A0ABS1WTT7_9GAMM|nr:DegV family protein [Steroidobacter gossypii]MBM0104363.1 DegV family EDD domain-containing protein [Steroidobacter gossypii]